MEAVLALLAGVMVAASMYLILSRNLVRFIFGLVLASNAVNLIIFAGGRFSSSRPPLIPEGALQIEAQVANSLPQALILTAIVIGFALLAFIFTLFMRASNALGTVDTERMAEVMADAVETPPDQEAVS